MFTGIVETAARVLERTDAALAVARPAGFTDAALGCSIAVSGVCLSVVRADERSLGFDVIPETWALTNLGSKDPGDRVNLERSLKADGRFEGHVVQGHVEGTAEVLAFREDGRWVVLTVRMPPDLLPFVVQKGGIALDGVSLTIAGLDGDRLSVALIPHTLQVTTLGDLRAGDRVNVETDILGRYVRAMLTHGY